MIAGAEDPLLIRLGRLVGKNNDIAWILSGCRSEGRLHSLKPC